jgi:signal transduction histidine kinase
MKKPINDRDLALLFDVSKASPEGSLDAYFTYILDRCVEWFSASGISVFIRKDHTDEFFLAAKLGAHTTVPDDAKLRTGEGIAGACIASGNPMLIHDPLDNPALLGRVRPREDVESAMVIPLVDRESGCIGVLNVSRGLGEQPFTSADLFQAGALARHIGMAVSNARLFAGMNEAVADTKAANEKLDATIECLGVGIIVCDAAAEIERWNPEASTIAGASISRGMTISRAFGKSSPELRNMVAKALKRAMLGKRYSDRAQDGHGKAWTIVASPLPRGGATIAVQDVSSHEEVLKELDRVKRLAEIGQMTAAIAHEIRNPLTGIRSAAQMVQAAPGEVGEFGGIIEREALKLNALCDEFLEFAKPLSLHVEKLDLLDILQRVCNEYKYASEKASVRISLMMDSCSPKIKGDLVRVEQICRNLLLNAIQASRPGGVVTVKLVEGKLMVEDEGQGIESEIVQKLFTPFFTTKANGTGLGLSNVRKIVDAHGWQIQVTSQPGTGTRFEVHFQEQKAA